MVKVVGICGSCWEGIYDSSCDSMYCCSYEVGIACLAVGFDTSDWDHRDRDVAG